MVDSDEIWKEIGPDSELQTRPDHVIEAPILGASQLPLKELSWEDFERLQWRILRDVEGLRNARLYGKRGQAQHGLDIISLDPAGQGIALQSKNYQKFDKSDLSEAVQKFQKTKRPFEVNRFIIGVACDVKDTKVLDSLFSYQKDLFPVHLDLWGTEEISALLRSQPAIVIEFFGLPTAKAFCLPFNFAPTEVPSTEVVTVQEALARTPEETIGASSLFRSAKESEENPASALELIEEGQEILRKAGFRAHAEQYERDRFSMLLKLDRANDAARSALDGLWVKLSLGRSGSAEHSARQLRQIFKDKPDDQYISDLTKVAETAITLHLNPLGEVPTVESLKFGELQDRIRLAILAGGNALANNRMEWLSEASDYFIGLATEADADQKLQVQLRIIIAEVTGDWQALLEDARKLRLGNDLGALVTARYARNRAMHQEFEEADALWNEASGGASLKKRWVDASTWVFSRRAFRTRWRPFVHDDLLTMEIALDEMGPSESVLRRDDQAYATALEKFQTRKLREAAIAVQRALRQAIAISDWVGEERARRLLGAILFHSDEPELAAHHLSLGADVEAIEKLAAEYPGLYIDVVALLDAPNYWTVGTAYRLLAAEADFIPDEAINEIIERIIAEIQSADSNTFFDAHGFSTSRYLGAMKALASVANRLTESQADTVLGYFEKQPPVEPNYYRFHDDEEANSVAHIALSHAALQKRAMAHLVPLLARSQSARGSITLGALHEKIDSAKEYLNELVQDGNQWAKEMLTSYTEADVSSDAVLASLERLTKPLQHTPGVYSVGTNAIGDSLMIALLPVAQRTPAITELLRRAEDTRVSAADRNDYLLAASKLVEGLEATTREMFLLEAVRLVSTAEPSEYDAFTSQFEHKLGSLRVHSPDRNISAAALHLAACLADGDEQRVELKRLAYQLLGASERSDYLVARALQRLGAIIDNDLGFLAGQSWTLRSIAAIRWVQIGNPEHLGEHLAIDNDVRVRRDLAEALAAATPLPVHADAHHILSKDPAYSVRSIVKRTDLSEVRATPADRDERSYK